MATNPQKTDALQMRKLTRGRKFSTEELQLKILWLLSQSPAHGYALAKRFAEISGDYYRPSPGVLYPALAQLEDWGLVKVLPIGKRKVYHLEQAGLKKLEENAEDVQFLIAALKHAAKKMQWMSQLPGGEAAASEATGWLPEFIQARKVLKMALLTRSDANHQEQRRIMEILLRAAQEITETPHS